MTESRRRLLQEGDIDAILDQYPKAAVSFAIEFLAHHVARFATAAERLSIKFSRLKR